VFARSEAHSSGLLAVDDVHRIHWEESGRPDGIPALYLHGGPGSGLGPGGYRMKFDPDRFRIVGFDQRGCGRSTPHVTEPGYDLARNTTQHLIADIEALRRHLGIDRWLVNGVSWGSTLALAYAQAHPHRVLGIVLMAVTAGGRSEIDWITEAVGAIYPEAWDRVATHAELAGIGYRRGEGRLVEAYARLMTDPDPVVRDDASRAWRDWEDAHVSIGTGGAHPAPETDDGEERRVFATLVTHYWTHDCFLTPPVLDRMDRLHGIPATLVHGRLDVSGPAVVAWRLHRAWPGSELIVEEWEGHGGPAMLEAWCDANTRHADRLDLSGFVSP
jgi:proline iminopeptidase